MRKILLDTNFILTCIRNKIDFFEELEMRGLKILIPEQVIDEIKRIAESDKKLRFRDEAIFALKLLKKEKFEKINLGKKYVDAGILDFVKDDSSLIVATLDLDLKKKLSNNKMVIRGKKSLEIV